MGNSRTVIAVLALAHAAAAPALAGTTERVSVGIGGSQADSASATSDPAISADGRFVAFASNAPNLVPGGNTDRREDIFVRDRRAGRTERVSVSTAGIPGNNASLGAKLSANGRYVAFLSFASNLVPGDTNFEGDVFLRDRRRGFTELVSIGLDGAPGNQTSGRGAVSASGRFVVFESGASNLVPNDTNGASDVFVRDRWTPRTERVSVGPLGAQGNGLSGFGPTISNDDRFVAFLSEASNLVPDDTNGVIDVFVRDRRTGRTQRINLGPRSTQANDVSPYLAISPGGHFVAFASNASNLVRGDTNGASDIFVRDLRRGRTTRVSLRRGGGQADGGTTGSTRRLWRIAARNRATSRAW